MAVYYTSQCVVIRSAAHIPWSDNNTKKGNAILIFFSLCAFSLTSAIESGHIQQEHQEFSSHFSVHFWVVMGGWMFHPIHFDFLFSPRRAISNAIPIIFLFFFFCIPSGLVASGKEEEEDVDGTCHLVSTFFPSLWRAKEISSFQRIGKKLFIRFKLSVRL